MAQSSTRTPQLKGVPRAEEVLADRYEQLCAWAAGLTRGDVGVALDLVHDLYVYITLAKVDLSRVENLDNYLYKCLRHIHLAHLTESSRNALQHVSVADLDSLELAVWTNGEHYLLEQQNELRRISRYAIWRKDQSKSASFFILRFFHGYHVGEIAELANVSLSAVNPRLSRIRTEIRHYLENPQAAQFSDVPGDDSQWTAISSIKLFRELRASILGARGGDCLSEEQLLAHYRSLVPKPISCSLLSHLVSCQDCLSVLDRHFRRPTLGDREPLDGAASTAKGKIAKAGASMPPLDHKEMLKLALRHRQDVYEHRPQLLSIAVDGKIIASHRVQGPESTQLARIERPEQIGCIEVYSEQDVRLAFVLVEDLPPNGPSTRTEHIELSDGRWVEVRLNFDSLGLDAEVTYFDPMPMLDAEEDEADSEGLSLALAAAGEGSTTPGTGGIVVIPPKGTSARERRALATTSAWRLWRKGVFSHFKSMFPFDINPLFAGAMVLAIASVACFLSWLHVSRRPAVTPIALLDNAAKWDMGIPGRAQPGVIYQKVKITAQKRSMERAIYRDAEARRKPKQMQLPPMEQQLRYKLQAAGVNWDAPLSAAEYRSWRGQQQAESDQVTRAGDNLLKLTTTVNSPGSTVVSETLTVRESDFHPVNRTLEIKDYGTVEIAELNYDVLPWNMANPDWFEPVVGSLDTRREMRPSLTARLPYIPSATELDEAYLATLRVLNEVHADKGEQVSIVPAAHGFVVKGLVQTEERKRQIETALEIVRFVSPAVFTYDEMARRETAQGDEPTSIKTADETRQPSPLEVYLVPLGRPRDTVSELARTLVEHALTASRDGNASIELLSRFSSGHELSPQAQQDLAGLIANHRQDLVAALNSEEQLLRSAGFSPSPSETVDASSAQLTQLSTAIATNQRLCWEMASTKGQAGRPAQEIAQAIFAEIARARSTASALSVAENLTNAAATGRPSNQKDR